MAAAVILCVDDEQNNRDLLRAVLVPRGFEVVEAADGPRALAAALEYQPSLILLDLMMPEVSGFDVAQALKGRADTAAIPILALAAKRLTRAVRAKLNGLVARVMEKTEFKPETFISEVYHALMLSRAGGKEESA